MVARRVGVRRALKPDATPPLLTDVRAGAELLLERGRFCFAPNERCAVDANGVVDEGLPPECACACDPNLPD